jgi:hypothetical protein
VQPSVENPPLWKMIGLALVATRGAKLRYWKQILSRLTHRRAYRGP